MKMIKTALTVLMAMILLLGCIVPASAAQYVTIADIREETKDGWHETYTFKGEEIRVDVDIEIPDVDKVPIVRIKEPGEIYPNDAPENADVTLFGNEGFLYSVEPTAASNSYTGFVDREQYSYGAQAENSPFTSDEAVAFALEKLQPYCEMYDLPDLQIRSIAAFSRLYKANDNAKTINFDEPITEAGNYDIDFSQSFYGIPYHYKAYPFVWPLKSEPQTLSLIGDIYAVVVSEEKYAISFRPAIEDELLANDVPLLPFSEIRKEYEHLINTGYIRDVYNIRLGYFVMDNPNDLGNTSILIPVWELSGAIVNHPSNPTPAPVFADRELQKRNAGRYALINAQTAKYYNPEDKSRDRKHGTYITWDEVK